MISEIAIMTLAATLFSSDVKTFSDEEVEKMFNVPAKLKPVGTKTNWVDMTKFFGRPHSVWLEKTKNNSWEMRGAM